MVNQYLSTDIRHNVYCSKFLYSPQNLSVSVSIITKYTSQYYELSNERKYFPKNDESNCCGEDLIAYFVTTCTFKSKIVNELKNGNPQIFKIGKKPVIYLMIILLFG